MTQQPAQHPVTRAPSVHREILALAIPAFATLVSEPLLVIADSAIIGHLATDSLAGLGLAGNILGVTVGLCIFLAYGTTAQVSRNLGAGRRGEALAQGFDGMVLAAALGLVLAVAMQFAAPVIIGWYDPAPEVAGQALTYLRVVSLGLPALLVMLASTGVLRGLQDTRTPLYVAIGVNLLNIGLNFALVYGARLGLFGAAIGTLTSQIIAAAVLAGVVLRGARREHASLRVRPQGVLSAARGGVWLLLRTASLQASITATTVVATHLGIAGLAAHQVTYSLWTFLAFALDALAIACQAIIGRHLGAGDVRAALAVMRTVLRWGVLGGAVLGAVIIAARPLIMPLFTSDPAVHAPLGAALLVVGLMQPLAGVVFVLDGVLIGAGDARYLAIGGALVALVHVPLVFALDAMGPTLWQLWVLYGVFMLGRAVVLGRRVRTNAWMRLGG
ncbi:MATE family efflux transporter [Propionibacteriaceae bacterium G57]|uniref:MATE family efflux transporter n=1 Tax=Aestuariimicrobium sp. G57 TaxID=3418485 RepID=UPI003DA71B9D